VELSVIREGVDQALNFSIVRDTIKIASVSWEKKDNGIAYIKISHFNEDTYQNFSQIIPAILETKPRGLVLDLRDNPGGFLNVAIDVAGEWIAGKAIVIEKYSDTQEDTYGSEVASRLAKNLKQ
jgi:carboxyl-terminal processing protease